MFFEPRLPTPSLPARPPVLWRARASGGGGGDRHARSRLLLLLLAECHSLQIAAMRRLPGEPLPRHLQEAPAACLPASAACFASRRGAPGLLGASGAACRSPRSRGSGGKATDPAAPRKPDSCSTESLQQEMPQDLSNHIRKKRNRERRGERKKKKDGVGRV